MIPRKKRVKVKRRKRNTRKVKQVAAKKKPRTRVWKRVMIPRKKRVKVIRMKRWTLTNRLTKLLLEKRKRRKKARKKRNHPTFSLLGRCSSWLKLSTPNRLRLAPRTSPRWKRRKKARKK